MTLVVWLIFMTMFMQADDENANLLLYASTLRWLQSYYQVIQDVSRPIRKGSVFNSIKVPKLNFFRSIRYVAIINNIVISPSTIFSMYV